MTEDLANQLGGVSWKIAKESGENWSVTPDAVAVLERSEPEITFRNRVVIAVKIVGDPELRMIDVTEKVQQAVGEELGFKPGFCVLL